MPEPHTREQVVIRTRSGPITVAPDGAISGLWELCRKELMTAAEARRYCKCKTRVTFLRWRAKGFPEPVMSFPANGGPLELWSRTEVRTWIRAWRAAHADLS